MVAHSNCKMAKTVRELDTVMQLWNHDTNQVMEAIARNGGDAVVAAEIWKQREYKQSVYPINEWELTMFSQAELSKMDDLVRLIFVNRQYRLTKVNGTWVEINPHEGVIRKCPRCTDWGTGDPELCPGAICSDNCATFTKWGN